MAGEQDILSLGLDVKSFNAAKKKTLKDFIELFDTLSKYDGKVYNPILGDGLTTFNKSIVQTNELIAKLNVSLERMNAMLLQSAKDAKASSLGLSQTSTEIVNSVNQTDILVKKKTQESKVVKDLTTDYRILKNELKRQADVYRESYLSTGPKSVQTRTALKDYQSTSKVIEAIDVNLARADRNGLNFGKSLSTIYNRLRIIAYILPGIGIAGIFNLAFDAIEKVVEEMGFFNNKMNESIKLNTEQNKALKEQISSLTELTKKTKDFYESIDTGSLDNIIDTNSRIDESYQSLYKTLTKPELTESRGFDQGKVLSDQINANKQKIDNSIETLKSFDKLNFVGVDRLLYDAKALAREKLKDIASINKEIEYYTGLIINKQGGFSFKDQKQVSASTIKLLKEEAESRKSLTEEEFKTLYGSLSDYYQAKKALDTAENKRTKFEEDQNRKLTLETTKSDLSVKIDANKQILASDKKFHDEKEAAIRDNYRLELELNKANLDNVTNNISSTSQEIATAYKTYTDENKKALAKMSEDIEKNDVEFYQRRILALTEIQKDSIELEAITNERIFLNETNSLDDRLKAYEEYIRKKQQIKDLEYQLAIQKGAAKPGGKTSLTQEEQERIDNYNNNQKLTIQADTENKIYDIVKQSLDKQIKAVIDANETELSINREAYYKELSANNERFKNKIFSYEAFKKNKEAIDKKYRATITLEDEIKDDEQDLERSQKLYDDLLKRKEAAQKNVEAASVGIENDKVQGRSTLISQREYDAAVGTQKAINDAIIKAEKELNEARLKLDKDRISAAQKQYEQLIQFEKEYADNKRQIEEGVFNFVTQFINAELENKLHAIDEVRRSRDEQYGLEQSSVEKSSLDQKNKAALEIQLAQQKLTLDKQAAAEEKRLKREAAVHDRELAVAHILWSKGEAVLSALKLPPPAGEILAIQRGILAGIELATVLAVPIPSYAHGTEDHKGGYARFGEDGAEIVKEPGKDPYLVTKETIADLPAHTKVIPIRNDYPEFGKKNDDSWKQTEYLAKSIAKSNKKEIKNIFKPTIIVDIGFESRKRQVLGY